ncbi:MULTISPECIES: hypothetical protein [unclassified Oceanobacter]|uniref:hypothetical protein n=1 Tax=unclassified Oceanobacter TaxID=2620260 RepID=UPI00273374A6|nr:MULTISPECIES: hypothetical protein [unclassified Oceanobacter]MDP2609104.1 hypothetical protein [Oceanobacter sp. 1_MG-2023]MDP2612426.1 hypothetical protein [Oceanobacter sp. 2_MG-2023]
MATDFLDAHRRHWQDAELLFQHQRWANADHLYGFSAECGLKKLMQAFGMDWDSTRDQPQKPKDRKHADGIWNRYNTYQSGHVYGLGFELPDGNPFDNWHASQRYSHRDDIKQSQIISHKSGANNVCQLIKKAQLDGLL